MMDLRQIYKPTPFNGEVTVELDELQWFLARRDVNLSPSYQRGSVWTLDQSEMFMGHLLQGGEILPIIIQRVPDGGPQEVVDGKQRLTAMLAWLRGEIGARLDNGSLLRIEDLLRGKRGVVTAVMGLCSVGIRVKYINMPFAERVRFYVRLNSAGTPHTPEQLAHALAAKED